MTIPLLAFYNVHIKMEDDEIREMIRSGMLIVETAGDGPLLSIDGYENDPRDLWQIPEAVNFAKKLFAMGLCSVLTVSTTVDPKWNDLPKSGKPFGAFEVWLLAKEELGKKIEHKRLVELFNEFKIDLMHSNQVAAEVIEGRVNDGQHRVRGRHG